MLYGHLPEDILHKYAIRQFSSYTVRTPAPNDSDEPCWLTYATVSS